MKQLNSKIKFYANITVEVLQVLFEAAALCINTIRTFYLIILAILGPIVFGLAVFDGFQHTLTVWLAKYINVFLWLPVSNIFGAIIGKVQENMLNWIFPRCKPLVILFLVQPTPLTSSS